MIKVGVIGGGPSGIISAGFASSRGKEVTLIEKNNKLGKKLFITGKGRCNITNNSPIEEFFENIVTNNTFLYSSFYSFTNKDIINLLESYGVKTKVERGNRVFPVSNKSSDVIKAFEEFLFCNQVRILLNTTVKDVKHDNEKFIVTYQNNNKDIFNRLIIATGGKSYPATGSTGDGYNFAKQLGHTIEPLNPSLVPIEIEEDWIKNVQGLSLKNVALTGWVDNKSVHEEFGEMLFSHYGISGPIVLSMSNVINKYDTRKVKFSIDLKPALSKEKLDARILRDFELNKNKQIKNGLYRLLPKRIIPIIIHLASINGTKPINQITKEERIRIIHTIKNLPLTFKKFRPIEQAIVTSGGISINEIDPSTMESKIISGLYFAGEIIDVDGLTGGYNLQIAYSTGYLAGMNV
ncbi:NAD(P)/FAD-dependent oxidoreductase [Schnuerera sp. xch1]|uniref:NAD(P)/FAD-dependent oxidoreductase n=1 Tax=Schnuerera sp. xch1 TaxID=2874283 RepID=UPI0021D8C522|nr:NAD(P)/FAD-dependent oxidoreductase [Schnuerera sp. xch1]